jgi:aarF domain-containing kinase
VFADVEGIKKHSLKMGAGEDLYTLFASVLTMRPWRKVIAKSIDHLQFSTTKEDVNEIQVDNLELYRIIYCSILYLLPK